MEVPTFVIALKDVDLKQHINFQKVLHKPQVGSKVFALRQIFDQLLEQILQKGMLPISVLDMADLSYLACQDNDISLNKRFVREAIGTFVKIRDDVHLVYRTKYQVYIERR